MSGEVKIRQLVSEMQGLTFQEKKALDKSRLSQKEKKDLLLQRLDLRTSGQGEKGWATIGRELAKEQPEFGGKKKGRAKKKYRERTSFILHWIVSIHQLEGECCYNLSDRQSLIKLKEMASNNEGDFTEDDDDVSSIFSQAKIILKKSQIDNLTSQLSSYRNNSDKIQEKIWEESSHQISASRENIDLLDTHSWEFLFKIIK